jgi:hypothetical protein
MKWSHELNENELEELRQNYFYQLLDNGEYDVLGGVEYASDIPMDRVIKHYKDTFFVDEDFFCNIK